MVCEIVWLLVLIVRSQASILAHSDFPPIWIAARFVLQGDLRAVYDPFAMAVVEHRMHLYAGGLVQPFLYPPTYLLLCVPLAAMPLGVAGVAFLLAGLAPLLLCLGRLLPQPRSWLPALAFPGLMVTAGSGQNGLLTAACFGGGAVLLDDFPLLAGMCLGLLTFKPHLALLVPVALLAARRWRALAGAAISALGMIVLSCLAFGTQVWTMFPEALAEARHVLFALRAPGQLQSLFGGALILHAPIWLALACQAWFSLAVVGLLVHVARRRPGGRAEGATLAICGLAASPYLMDYDLAVLAIPLAWLFAEAQRGGWRAWEKYAAMAVYIMPLLTRGIAERFGLPLAPVILAGFAAVIIGRAADEQIGVEAQQGAFAEI